MNDQGKILIVEDEMSLNEVLEKKFQQEGFVTFSAIDGEEGLTLAFKEHPEIILLDIVMPKMNGFEMLDKLRLDAWGRTVPVIILTNFGGQEKVFKAIEGGVYEYLIKSNWRLEDIVKEVRNRLS